MPGLMLSPPFNDELNDDTHSFSTLSRDVAVEGGLTKEQFSDSKTKNDNMVS